MRKLKRTFLILIVVMVGIFSITRLVDSGYTYKLNETITKADETAAFHLLNELLNKHDIDKYTYVDYLNEHQHEVTYNHPDVDVDLFVYDDVDLDLNKPVKMLEEGDIARYELTLTEGDYYTIDMNYLLGESSLNDVIVSLKINGETFYSEMNSIILPTLWKDESKEYSTDRYGDEVLSNQVIISGWQNQPLYGSTYQSIDPLMFYFESGENVIEVENMGSTPVTVANIHLQSPKKYDTYVTYLSQHVGPKIQSLITVDAIDYVQKNSSYVQSFSLNNPSVQPFDAVYKKLNVIDGATWKQSGQSLTYDVTVETAGFYQLAIKYINDKADFKVFRSIAIDGEIPFEEFRAYAVPTTRATTIKMHTLSNGDIPYEVYLSKGTHTITIKAESEPVQNSLRQIQLLIDHINAFSLEIRKITGKSIDKDRTWQFTQYIPETPAYLEAYQLLIKTIITDLSSYAPNQYESSTISNLQKALFRLNNIYKDYERLPFYLDDLIGGSGSVTQYLGNSLTEIAEQPMYLDELYLYSDTKLPKENVGFFRSMFASLETFMASFSSNKFKQDNDPKVVDVWVNRPITYVDMMQKMADQNFTEDTGIRVKISVMPDPNKLVMSAAAGQQPDVALGLASYMPYDLAIRNAAYDLSSFPDYWSFASAFSPGAFIPYVLNDKAYAIPETLDFNVLMYRKDIFDALGFMVPDTWEEVIQILPELQQYGMNFYHPIAGSGGTKYFYQTSGFIYQYNGALYDTNGMNTTINTKASIEGLTFLNQLFTNYSLPEQVQSFYNAFRYATLPIGISDFQNYLLIKNAAPEIVGQWRIAPYPSVTPENGETNRYYIANGTAGMILNGTKKPNESWAFLKWWLGEETQTKFAFNLQSTYGPTYAWLSANIHAVENSPLPEGDKRVILEQVKWLIDVPRTPGQYMLERSLSNIWTDVVFNGESTGIAVDQYTILINREIRKKMIEFGFIDQNGDVLKVYTIPTIEWIQDKMMEASGGYHGSDN